MNFQQPQRMPDLRSEIWRWLSRHPNWYLRPLEPSEDDQFAIFGTQSYRHPTPSEVAAEIVNDPALREALGFLASPPGQAIEQAIAQIWLTPVQAELLTAGCVNPNWPQCSPLIWPHLWLCRVGSSPLIWPRALLVGRGGVRSGGGWSWRRAGLCPRWRCASPG